MSVPSPSLPPSPGSGKNKFGEISADDISIPEMEARMAAAEEEKIAKIQQANPQAPNAEGLNSSGLPSAQAYYTGKKKEPIHTAVITPICESRLFIKIVAIGALLMAFFWIKFSIDGIRFNNGFGAIVHHSIRLILSFFLFIKPAMMMFQLIREIDVLEHDRDETYVGNVLYGHAQLWKHMGVVVVGTVLFALASMIGGSLGGMFQLN